MAVKPQLYLFLSVDVIGSTALKYGKGSSIDDWYSFFTDFYVSFPDELKTHLESEYDYRGNLQYSPEKLVIWKHAGDEILFYIEITQKGEIPCIVSAFKKTLEDWYTPKVGLNVKGSVWTGQVPFIDRKLTEEGNPKFDFIGPSIDCGFRLGKYASKDEIAISVEVADLLNDISWIQSSLYYLKSENLKGVLGDKKYPIFVLKLDGAKTAEYDYLKSPCRQTNLDKYIEKYYIEIEKDFSGKVSRIGKDIPSYLNTKVEVSNSIPESKTAEQHNAKEIESDKQGDTEEFEEYENLVSSNDDKVVEE